MRPQQQNRRMRGRNNNNHNRKGPNPLTRNYESNGPDVKIRGSAQQIAEKYTTLARDAQSSGDRVMAENYLQHAEHYNRIIAAAQAQMAIQNVHPARDEFDDDLDEDQDGYEGGAAAAAEAPSAPAQNTQNNGTGPQPVIEGVPAEVALNAQAPRQHQGGRHRDRRFNGEHPRNEGRPEQRNDANAADGAAPAPADEPAARSEAAPEPAAREEGLAPALVAAQPAPAESAAAPEAAAVEDAQPERDAAMAEPAKPRRGRRPRRATAEAGAGETPENPAPAEAQG